MYCQNCGAVTDDSAQFCANCGQRVVRAPTHAGGIGPVAPAEPETTFRPAVVPGTANDPAMRFILPVGRSPWAIAAGYAGLFALTCVLAPVALILGIVAIMDLRAHPQKYGWGRAIFGTVMGAIGTIVTIFALVMTAIDASRH